MSAGVSCVRVKEEVGVDLKLQPSRIEDRLLAPLSLGPEPKIKAKRLVYARNNQLERPGPSQGTMGYSAQGSGGYKSWAPVTFSSPKTNSMTTFLIKFRLAQDRDQSLRDVDRVDTGFKRW